MLNKLRNRKYIGLIGILILVIGIIGILNIGHYDFSKNKLTLTNISANRLGASVVNTINEIAYNENVSYEIKYTIEGKDSIIDADDRKVIITANIPSTEYASWKLIEEENISSSLSDEGRTINVEISNLETNKEYTQIIELQLRNAPNEYKISPTIEVKESTEEISQTLKTKTIEVNTNSIVGKIIDTETKQGIESVELRLLDENNNEVKRTYTNEEGKYTFSGLDIGKYKIEVVEEIYEEVSEIVNIDVSGSNVYNIEVKVVNSFTAEVKKYIKTVTLINNGKEEKYSYEKLEKVVQAVKKLKDLSGTITYEIDVKNTSSRDGYVKVVTDIIPSGMKFDKDLNPGWEEIDGKVYNKTLGREKIKSGETKTLTIVLTIDNTNEAKTYLNNVVINGETYHKVVYMNEGKVYHEEEVLETELLTGIELPEKEGYTFTGWYTDKNLTNKYNYDIPVTKDLVLYAGYMKNETGTYTVTFLNDNVVYGEVQIIEANGKIIKPENPSKEYNIFNGWSKDGILYDLDTPVTENLILVAEYTEIPNPTIKHEPTSWTNESVMVTITGEEGYDILYKIDSGEWKEYTESFRIDENSKVYSKLRKENIDGKIVEHIINNIDKIPPIIETFNFENILATSVDIESTITDEISGLKTIEIYFNDNRVFEANFSEEDVILNSQEIEQTISGLTELTNYEVKVIAVDKAGNKTEEIKTIKTIEKNYVAKIIGRNSVLNSTLIENEIIEEENKLEEGESLSEEKIEEIKLKYADEKFETLEEAVESCGDIQCTIQMIKDTTESVIITDLQEITLDLNGKTITGINDSTIKNNGILILNESSSEPGELYNPENIAVVNDGKLQLGINEGEVLTKPIVRGYTYGIKNNNIFDFYDGMVIGDTAAISGVVSDFPYSYNVSVTMDESSKVATLKILANAEVAIGTVYYTKFEDARKEVQTGETIRLLRNITLADNIIVNEGEEFTINLNSYNLDVLDYTITNNGNLTISDESYVENTKNAEITHDLLQKYYDNDYDEKVETYNLKYQSILEQYEEDYQEKLNKIGTYTIDDYIKNGLVAHYDGYNYDIGSTTWKDMSGNDNNATISSATYDNNSFLTTYDTNFNVGNFKQSDGFTLEWLFSYDSVTYGNTIYWNGLSIFINSNSSGKYFSISTYGLSNDVSYNIEEGKKYLLTVIYDNLNEEIKTYINGEFISSFTPPSYFKNYTDEYSLSFGKYINGNSYAFRLYNRAISYDEIIANYDADNDRYSIGDIKKKELNTQTKVNSNYTFVGNESCTSFVNTNQNFYSTSMCSEVNMAGVYYNDVVSVDEFDVTYSGTLKIANNYGNTKTGTIYIGFATSNNLTIDDYVEYMTIPAEYSSQTKYDYSVTAHDKGDYYFKIITVNESIGTSTRGSIEVYLDNIYKDIKPVKKIVELETFELNSSIISGTNFKIVNNENSILSLKAFIYSSSHKGNSTNYARVIENSGELNLNNSLDIAMNSDYSEFIYNTGNVFLNSDMKIKLTYSHQNFIHAVDTSKINYTSEDISNLDLNISYSKLFYLEGNATINVENIESNFYSYNGYFIHNQSNSDINIKNAKMIPKQSLSSLYFSNEVENTITVDNSTLYSITTKNSNVIISNSEIGTISDSNNPDSSDSTIISSTITNSTVDSLSFKKAIKIENSNINSLELRDTSLAVSEIDGGTYGKINNYSKLSINNINAEQIYNYKGTLELNGENDIKYNESSSYQYAIYNSDGLINMNGETNILGNYLSGIIDYTNYYGLPSDSTVGINIIGKTKMELTYYQNIAINCVGSGCKINIGVKDGVIDNDNYVFKTYTGISSGGSSPYSELNYYDGKFITNIGSSISGKINNIEDESSIVVEDNDTNSIMTLSKSNPVAKIGDQTFNSVQSAIDSIDTDEIITIEILRNVFDMGSITNTKNIVIDLKGNNLSIIPKDSNTYPIVNNGTLKFINSNDGISKIMVAGSTSSYTSVIENNGTLTYGLGSKTVLGSVMNRENAILNIIDGVNDLSLGNYGTLNISGGETLGTITNYNIMDITGGIQTSGTITNSGTMNIDNFILHDQLINNNKLTINNLTATNDVSSKKYAITNNTSSAELTINNISLNSASSYGIKNNGIMTINDGTIYSALDALTLGSSTTTTITGGTIIGKTGISAGSSSIITLGIKDSDVSIEKPYIKGTSYGISGSLSTINMYDGVIIGPTSNSYNGGIGETEDGYDIVTDIDEETSLEKSYLSKIYAVQLVSNGEKYYTIEEALSNAETTDKIILLRNITVASSVTVTIPENMNITFEFNNMSLTTSSPKLFINNGTLSFTNSENTSLGSIISTGETIVENNGTLNLNGSTYTSTAATGTSFINNSEMTTKNSTTINVANILLDNRGTVELTTGEYSSSMIDSYNLINSGSLTLNNATVLASGNGINNMSEGALILNNSTIEADNKNTILVNDGNVTLNSSNIYLKEFIWWYSSNRGNNVTLIINNNHIKGNITNIKTLNVVSSGRSYSYKNLAIENNGNIEFDELLIDQFTDNLLNNGTATITNSRNYNLKYGSGITNNSGATLTIGDGLTSAFGAIDNAGTMITNGGYFCVHSTCNSTYISNSGNFNMNGKSQFATDGDAIRNSGNFIINGTTTFGTNNSSIINTGTMELNGVISIKGSEYGIENSGDITLNTNVSISNCTYGISSTSGLVELNGSATITGGDYGIYYSSSNTSSAINIKDDVLITDAKNGIYNRGKGTITIGEKDGEINAGPTISGTEIGLINEYSGNLYIYDGTFNGPLRKSIVGTVTEIEENSNLINSVSNNIEIYRLTTDNVSSFINVDTNEEYNTLSTAVNSIENEGTIKQLRDIIIPSTTDIVEIPNGKSITIDTSDYYIYNGTKNYITNSGKLNITSNDNSLFESYYAIFIQNNEDGELNLINGTLYSPHYTQNLIKNVGTINITNMDISTGNLNYGKVYSDYYTITNNGTMEIVDSNIVHSLRGAAIYNSSTLVINNSTISGDSSYNSIYSRGVTTINGTTVNSGKLYSSGTLTINDINITASTEMSGTNVINNGSFKYIKVYGNTTINDGTFSKLTCDRGETNVLGGTYDSITTTTYSGITLNVSNSTINNSSGNGIAISGSSSNVTIKDGTVVNASNYGIYISNSSANVNIGENDGIVSNSSPSITGNAYGVYISSGIVNFYDGLITGPVSKAIYGTVTGLPENYNINRIDNETNEIATLIMGGQTARIFVVNGISYDDLQSAIDAVEVGVETGIDLYSNYTLDSSKTYEVPEGKVINLYLNGYTIDYNGNTINTIGTLNIIEGSNDSGILGSIINLIEDALNINQISRNVIIFEMDNGEELSIENNYSLYKLINDEYVKQNVKEELYNIGRYSITRDSNDDMIAINNRIYLNSLEEGQYKLIDNKNNELIFEITDEGKVFGNVRLNTSTIKNTVLSSAVAELIITIQTGIIRAKYILLTILIGVITMLLIMIKKQNASVK